MRDRIRDFKSKENPICMFKRAKELGERERERAVTSGHCFQRERVRGHVRFG